MYCTVRCLTYPLSDLIYTEPMQAPDRDTEGRAVQ